MSQTKSLGRALLHSAVQQRRRKHRDGMILVFAREFNSSCGLHIGISRSREMQHEQREVPKHTSYETTDSRRLPERRALRGSQLSSAACPRIQARFW